MKIIHSIDRVGEGSFGLGAVCRALAEEQIKSSEFVEIWTFDKIKDLEDLEYAIKKVVKSYKPTVPAILLSVQQLVDSLVLDNSAVIHQHGIWTGKSMASLVVSKRNVPVVIAPHGSLQQWALNKSKLKKRIVSYLYELHNMKLAKGFHAVSTGEVDDIRQFGVRSPVAMIPNGISSQWIESDRRLKADTFWQDYGVERGSKVLLYLSRITPKKGLDMLLMSLKNISYEGWSVVIAGADEFGYLETVMQMVKDLGLRNIYFPGPLYGEDKLIAFQASSMFILPSYSEGAPMVILEALGAGLPAITTQASPWEELNLYGCGFWTSTNKQGITEALEETFSLSDIELIEMGRQGKELVREKYLWSSLSEMVVQYYHWLNGDVSAKPSFVSKI